LPGKKYKLARSFLKIISKVADPLYEAIYPELVKVYESDNIDNFVNLIKRATLGMAKIIVPIGIVVFIFADQILSLVYGSEFGLATGVVRILVFAVIISDLASFTSTAFLAAGNPGLRTKIETIALIVYITLLFLLVPYFAQIGAALSLLAFALVLALLNIVSFNKYVVKQGG
jgi:O-antigen/teichoic acid export membrane protein